MTKRYCVTFAIDYLERLPDHELSDCLIADGRKLSATEVRGKLAAFRAFGYEGVPVCDKADDKGFCAGHEIEEGSDPR